MKKPNGIIKKFLKTSLCLIFGLALCFAFFLTQSASAQESIPLASGYHQKWIDRIDFTDADYARDFYDWLVENSDGDGENDALIDGSLESITVRTITGETSYDVTADGSTENKVKEAMSVVAQANQKESFAYISSAFYAFDRDYPQVFWLSGALNMASKYSVSYDSHGKITYNQEIIFNLKGNGFDIRANDYANEIFDIYEQIDIVNGAINSILCGIDSGASRYEKVEYFNDWLTKNNAYANVVGAHSRDCRGALLGQDANSPYAPVCEGYARAFKVLCDKSGIPCTLSNGNAKGEGHMWALVQMENGEWYGVDVTWNDPTVVGIDGKTSGYESHDYLLVGANTIVGGYAFKDSHIVTNTASQNGVSFLNQPQISLESYGAPVKEGEWDISVLGDGSLTASLYQTGEHTLLNPAYKLIIWGNGEMKECSNSDLPWRFYAFDIVEMEIRSGVTLLQSSAFYGALALKRVTFLGDTAFFGNPFSTVSSELVIATHKGYNIYNKVLEFGWNFESICELSEWQKVSEQSCETDEEFTATCFDCGDVESKLGKLAHGHDYGKWAVFSTPTESETGVAKRVCSHDNSHAEVYDLPALSSIDYAYSVKDKPSCEQSGKGVYEYSKNGVEVAVEVDISSLGHDFDTPTYTWEYSLKKCKATAICKRDNTHVLTENGIVTASIDHVDCETEGEVAFTAIFTNPHFSTQQSTTVLVAKGHEFSKNWSYSDTEHWKECACGAKTDIAEHIYGEWEEKTLATVFNEGERFRSCECGHSQTEFVQKLNFFDALLNGKLDKQTTNLLIAGGGVLATIIFLAVIIAIMRKKSTKKNK